MKVWLNGKLVERDAATVSVFDHGLLYGDGVFEGIRAYRGRIFKLEAHLERLEQSAKAIMLPIPLSRDALIQAVREAMKANGLTDGYIRLIVTRGEGDLGLDPRKCRKTGTVIIIADRIELYPQEYYENGLEVITVATRRTMPDAVSPRIKSLNYLNNILAKIEANNAGVLEAIMLGVNGYVAELEALERKVETPCSGDHGCNCGAHKNTSRKKKKGSQAQKQDNDTPGTHPQ